MFCRPLAIAGTSVGQALPTVGGDRVLRPSSTTATGREPTMAGPIPHHPHRCRVAGHRRRPRGLQQRRHRRDRDHRRRSTAPTLMSGRPGGLVRSPGHRIQPRR